MAESKLTLEQVEAKAIKGYLAAHASAFVHNANITMQGIEDQARQAVYLQGLEALRSEEETRRRIEHALATSRREEQTPAQAVVATAMELQEAIEKALLYDAAFGREFSAWVQEHHPKRRDKDTWDLAGRVSLNDILDIAKHASPAADNIDTEEDLGSAAAAAAAAPSPSPNSGSLAAAGYTRDRRQRGMPSW
jgi:hypothetical protein